MRRSLRYALGLALALSALALLWPRAQPALVEAITPDAVRAQTPAHVPQRAAVARLEPLQIEFAAGDPFALPAAPATPSPPTPAPPSPVAAPAPQPVAPELTHRFFGRLTTPNGDQVTLLSRGDVPIAVNVGLTLSDGYVVQAVLPEAVRVTFPQLGTVIDIPVPLPPSSSR